MTKKTNYRDENPIEYEQGRRAHLAGVLREESPYSDTTDQDGKVMKSKLLLAWQAGYDDAEPEAARNETMLPEDAPNKAEGQIKTATK